jgi:hypothetical protein
MKVKVLYQTANEIEVEVDEKFAECARLADLSWDEFPVDRADEWSDDCDKLHWEVAEMLSQIDNEFDHVMTITTENDNIIYAD